MVVAVEGVAATMTGVAAGEADTVTRVASGTTLAAHMSEVIIVTAVERTEAGLREGKLFSFTSFFYGLCSGAGAIRDYLS